MSFSFESWPRVGPCLAVLAVVGIIVLGAAVPAQNRARRFEDDRRYLKSFRTPNEFEAFLSFCGDYAAKNSDANDVIFFGDSTCRYGIQTRQFEQQSGLIAYNLGTFGMLGSDPDLVLLKSYLEHHPALRIVVLCVSPRGLDPTGARERQPDENAQQPSDNLVERFLWCYGTAGEYPRPSHPEALKYYVSQGMLMALGELRGGEGHYFNVPISGKLGSRTYNNLRNDFIENRGYFVLNGSNCLPSAERRDVFSYLFFPAAGATADDPYPVSPVFDEGVRRLARLASDNGVLLMIRLAPLLQAATAERFVRINAWFDRLESECANIVCDRPEVLLYGPEYFTDIYFHLNTRGAEKFTAQVASSVTRLLHEGAANRSGASITDQKASSTQSAAE